MENADITRLHDRDITAAPPIHDDFIAGKSRQAYLLL